MAASARTVRLTESVGVITEGMLLSTVIVVVVGTGLGSGDCWIEGEVGLTRSEASELDVGTKMASLGYDVSAWYGVVGRWVYPDSQQEVTEEVGVRCINGGGTLNMHCLVILFGCEIDLNKNEEK